MLNAHKQQQYQKLGPPRPVGGPIYTCKTALGEFLTYVSSECFEVHEKFSSWSAKKTVKITIKNFRETVKRSPEIHC